MVLSFTYMIFIFYNIYLSKVDVLSREKRQSRAPTYVLMLSQPIGNLILKFNNYSAWSACEVLLRKQVDKTSSIPFVDCCDANIQININNKKKTSEILKKTHKSPTLCRISSLGLISSPAFCLI